MIRIINGNMLIELPKFEAHSVDACVTDPPYHLQSIHKRFAAKGRDETSERYSAGPYGRHATGFMGKQWDGGDIASRVETWEAVWRVVKPGAYLLAFGGTRTYHRMVCAIEDAGFEIRDASAWLYGSGFPKSLNVSKAIDRAKGVKGTIVPQGEPIRRMIPGADQNKSGWTKDNGRIYQPGEYVPATDEAAAWAGWGTALKPAMELICVARKPLIGTVAQNVLTHATGAINVNACQIPFSGDSDKTESKAKNRHADFGSGPRENMIFGADNRERGAGGNYDPPGRWPANICHDGSEEVLTSFAQFGEKNGGHHPRGRGRGNISTEGHAGQDALVERFSDAGSAARFFYTAKADSADRQGSKHPTVKPTDLMRWLVRLVTPPGGTVLDPFCGTGSTLLAADQQQFNAIGIEQDATYAEDARRKLLQDAPLFTGIDTPAQAPRSRLFT